MVPDPSNGAVSGQVIVGSFLFLVAASLVAVLVRLFAYSIAHRMKPYKPAQGIHGPIQCSMRDSSCRGKVTTRITDRRTSDGTVICVIRCDVHARTARTPKRTP